MKDRQGETELDRRLRAADPTTPAGDGWVADLVEATVSSTDTRTVSGDDAEETSIRHRWLVPATVAAAAVALAVGGYALAGRGGNDGVVSAGGVSTAGPSNPAPVGKKTVLELSLPPADTMASCLPFSADFLAPMSLAFSGTVIGVLDGLVQLEVDRWYRGGTAGVVQLDAPDPSSAALLGSVTFTEGSRYLVTATDGVVNSCGFTMPWTEQEAAVFDAAFSG